MMKGGWRSGPEPGRVPAEAGTPRLHICPVSCARYTRLHLHWRTWRLPWVVYEGVGVLGSMMGAGGGRACLQGEAEPGTESGGGGGGHGSYVGRESGRDQCHQSMSVAIATTSGMSSRAAPSVQQVPHILRTGTSLSLRL